MQGRKIFQINKNKQRLVLSRPSHIQKNSIKIYENQVRIQSPKKSTLLISPLVQINKNEFRQSAISQKKHRSLSKNQSLPQINLKNHQKSQLDFTKGIEDVANSIRQSLHLIQISQEQKTEAFIIQLLQNMTKANIIKKKGKNILLNQQAIRKIFLIILTLCSNVDDKTIVSSNLFSTDQWKALTPVQQKSNSKFTFQHFYAFTTYPKELNSDQTCKKAVVEKETFTGASLTNIFLNENKGSNTNIKSKQEFQKSNQMTELHFITNKLIEVNDFVNQQSNKHVVAAFKRHKYLEQQMFSYCDYLISHPLGAKTYRRQLDFEAMEKELQMENTNLSRYLIQSNAEMLVKCRAMRDFILKFRSQYLKIINQYQKVIGEKTKQAKIFTSKVTNWEQNYITRKEFLQNYKTEFCKTSFKVRQSIKMIQSKKDDLLIHKQFHLALTVLRQSFDKIEQIYLLGNSFY